MLNRLTHDQLKTLKEFVNEQAGNIGMNQSEFFKDLNQHFKQGAPNIPKPTLLTLVMHLKGAAYAHRQSFETESDLRRADLLIEIANVLENKPS